MKTIAATELKSKLSEILGDVERGEAFEVTRHGKVIGQIVPSDATARRAKAIDAIIAYKKSARPTGITIEEILSARDEGRKPL